MFQKIFVRKKKIIYIGIGVFLLAVIAYNTFSKINSVHYNDYSYLKNKIDNLQVKNKQLSQKIAKFEKNREIFYKNSIDTKILQKDLIALCNGLVRNHTLRECSVSIEANPYQYINVAKVHFHIDNKMDKMVLLYILNNIYNIKNSEYQNNSLIVEIFNKI